MRSLTLEELARGARCSRSLMRLVIGQLEDAGHLDRVGDGWRLSDRCEQEFGDALRVIEPRSATDATAGARYAARVA